MKDGDLIFLTDNRVLVSKHVKLPALMCAQRRAEKVVVTEEDLVKANYASFGDEIGKITNRITTMFEVQSHLDVGSIEYKTLEYRIKCGQKYQQDSIDRTKGIISKPMPKSWYDHHAALDLEGEQRDLYISILAEKKPYFMRYIYPDLSKLYRTYTSNTNKKALRVFGKTVKELQDKRADGTASEDELSFLSYYDRFMPVGIGPCVVNKICQKFESMFDGRTTYKIGTESFDYRILRPDVEYSRDAYNAIRNVFDEYSARLRDHSAYVKREHLDKVDARFRLLELRQMFLEACDTACSNAMVRCAILLDLCYKKNSGKALVWVCCGREIINTLLEKYDHMASFPKADENGEIEFRGKRFTMTQVRLGENYEDSVE